MQNDRKPENILSVYLRGYKLLNSDEKHDIADVLGITTSNKSLRLSIANQKLKAKNILVNTIENVKIYNKFVTLSYDNPKLARFMKKEPILMELENVILETARNISGNQNEIVEEMEAIMSKKRMIIP